MNDEAKGELQFVERAIEADQAVRAALAALIRKWGDADVDAAGCFEPQQVIRPALIGATKPLAMLAADWGVIGDTPTAIAAGFQRTVLMTIAQHLDGRREVGWCN